VYCFEFLTVRRLPSGSPSDINDLTWELYNYTLSVSNPFASAPIPLSRTSIGNEITAGLRWPSGSTSSHYNIVHLLHSVSARVKASNISSQPKIAVHLNNERSLATQKYWYITVLIEEPLATSDFDIMDVSYYPFYNN
jgi:arabinogalactan endo-1,4-beta-galactosidase